MKAVAYSIKIFEKEFLAKANNKKHDITLISNVLSMQTAIYARGKEAVIVNTTDDVSDTVIKILADFGVKYITTRSIETDHIDKASATKYGIKLANVPYLQQHTAAETILSNSQTILQQKVLQQIGDQTIGNLDLWQQGKCTGKACLCADGCSKI
jgi:lactate dehydrogenase-like 2-hydroxyacid dehydrogenase